MRNALVIAICLVLSFWAYRQTFSELSATWDQEPDYSHGYLVAPVTMLVLWAQRKSRPPTAVGVAWAGLAVVGAAALLKVAGNFLYVGSLEGLSIPLWLLGMAWLFFGKSVAIWSAPALGFLVFMIPMPWRFEHLLSLPLQRIATIWGCWLLQCFTVPAIAEGNTILIGSSRLEVADACTGLRTLIGVVAVAYLFCVLWPRPWWKKLILVCATAPVAMIANAVRIAATGLAVYLSTDVAWHNSVHEWAGLLMVPVATALFWFVAWYVDRLWVEVPAFVMVRLERFHSQPVRSGDGTSTFTA